MVDSCPKGYIHLELFQATTDTDRNAYESCVGSLDSGSIDDNYSMLIYTLQKSEIMDSPILDQRPVLHRETLYSNSGGAKREIDHVLVGGRSRLV